MSRINVALVLLAMSFPLFAVSDYEKWLNETTQNYQQFKDERDKEFTNYLKKAWKEMRLHHGLVRDETPKPIDIPVADVPDDLDLDVSEEQKMPVKIDIPETKPVEKPKIDIVVKPEVKKGKKVHFRYYGQPLEYYYDPSIKKTLSNPISKDNISDYWAAISNSQFEGVIKQLEKTRKAMELNDWGYALLVDSLSQKLFRNKNDKTLFTWFVLVKSGYNARVAHDRSDIFLLIPSRQKIYDVVYFDMSGTRYYALGFKGERVNVKRVHTYEGGYPDAQQALNLAIERDFKIKRKEKVRRLHFNYDGKYYQVKLKYDLNTVKFFETYPQMEIDQYFRSSVNSYTAGPVLEQLGKIVDGKDEVEAVNILLRFVQTSFKYATDQKQFGQENYLFPEETMHYTYSDCEDRSVLFAWLVRNLLDLDVVGLSYPGHIATAVKFRESVKGDEVNYKGQTYIISDPTYVNARTGMTMPDYQGAKATIIDI